MRYLALIFTVLLVACEAPQNPNEPYQLNQRQVVALFSGNTLLDPRNIQEFHDPAGFTAIQRKNEKGKRFIEVGTWSVKKAELCYKYPTTGATDHCWNIYRMPGGVYVQRQVGTAFNLDIKLVNGDPYGLRSKVTQTQIDQALAR